MFWIPNPNQGLSGLSFPPNGTLNVVYLHGNVEKNRFYKCFFAFLPPISIRDPQLNFAQACHRTCTKKGHLNNVVM